jgi:peptidoglycan hydrolase-like protein with peptidoglycan-binding domain
MADPGNPTLSDAPLNDKDKWLLSVLGIDVAKHLALADGAPNGTPQAPAAGEAQDAERQPIAGERKSAIDASQDAPAPRDSDTAGGDDPAAKFVPGVLDLPVSPEPEKPGDILSIGAPVGDGPRAKNNAEDVSAVQQALNDRAHAGLKVDGIIGPKTIGAIRAFQKALGGFPPDGLVEPGRNTARALAGGSKPQPQPQPKPKPKPQPDKTSKVNVTVADSSNDKPIKGASIKIGRESAETGEDGKTVVSLPQGIFPFTISADGFEDASGNHEVADDGDSEIIEVLTPAAAPPKRERSPTIFPEKVKALQTALAQLDGKVDEAIAAEADLRAAAAKRQIKLDDTDAVIARLTKAADSIDDGALKTLRSARELVDTALDALQNTLIEAEGARANVANFAKLQDLKTVDGDDGSEAIKQAVDAFDFWVIGFKALMDLLNPDPVLAVASAIAEFAGSDLVKDKLTDLLKKVAEQQKKIEDALNKAVTALQQLALAEIISETTRVRQLADLQAREVQHYHTAVSTFLKDLATLPTKPGAKPSTDMKAVTDTYSDVVTVSSRMKNLRDQIVAKAILADKVLRAAMLPLGKFDPDESKTLTDFQAKQVSGASAALVFNGSRGKAVFFVPSGIGEEDMEDMADALKHLDDLTPADKRMSDMSSAWGSAMRSGLSL